MSTRERQPTAYRPHTFPAKRRRVVYDSRPISRRGYGGHTAETVVFGEVSTGAADDIERAARIERRIVTQLGMSERLRPVAFGRKQQMIFLGSEIGEQKDYSDRLRRRRQVATAADTALAKRSAFHFSIMVG